MMCSHYQAVMDRATLEKEFGVNLPAGQGVQEVWPTYPAFFVRRPLEADAGDEAVSAREALTGVFGLIPAWAKDDKFARRTYNARSETAATLPSFRDAWRRGHKCIIPADAIYEPDWRSGKAQATRIARSNGGALGVAGLWSAWESPAGDWISSFTMLTINADDHPLMRNFHKPGDEKRMVVILPEATYDDWLNAPAARSMAFMRPYPADQLCANLVNTANRAPGPHDR